MKLYARRGFEWAEEGLVGLWCPVLTGGTQSLLLDCNPATNNHGTLTGYTDINNGWVGSDYGTVKNYNGTTDRDLCNINPLLGATNFSISVWARRTGTSNANLCANQYSVSGEFTGFRFNFNGASVAGINTNSFVFLSSQVAIVANNAWSTPANSFPQNTWKHCVMNFRTGSQVEFFIDGQRVTTTNWTGSTNANDIRWGTANRGLGFGRNSQVYEAAFFAGQIAEIKPYYNRTLSAGEAMQDFQAGPGGMWQFTPPKRRSVFIAAGFKAYWHRRQSQLIGGGV